MITTTYKIMIGIVLVSLIAASAFFLYNYKPSENHSELDADASFEVTIQTVDPTSEDPLGADGKLRKIVSTAPNHTGKLTHEWSVSLFPEGLSNKNDESISFKCDESSLTGLTITHRLTCVCGKYTEYTWTFQAT